MTANRVMLMIDVFILLWSALIGLLRSRAQLEAEILVLRQQINVLRRNSPKRFSFRYFRPIGVRRVRLCRKQNIKIRFGTLIVSQSAPTGMNRP
jgi:hypothetical protein